MDEAVTRKAIAELTVDGRRGDGHAGFFSEPPKRPAWLAAGERSPHSPEPSSPCRTIDTFASGGTITAAVTAGALDVGAGVYTTDSPTTMLAVLPASPGSASRSRRCAISRR